MKWYILVAVLLSCSKTAHAEVDPCLAEHHTEIDDWRRSTANDLVVDGLICDRELAAGWYRFTSHAGGDIATASNKPSRNHCGTQYPIFLDGELENDPGKDERIYKTCTASFLSSCAYQLEIKVKACEDFNVYYLVPSKGCAEGYCFGTLKKCPPGQTSANNGFEPDCYGEEPPDLSALQPSLTVKVSEYESTDDSGDPLRYKCNVFECDLQQTEDTNKMEFQVDFYIRDVLLYTDVVEGANLPSEFPETELNKLQLNDSSIYLGYEHDLVCQLRARWLAKNDSVYGHPIEIAQFFGITVQPTNLTLPEGETGEVTLNSNLPIHCYGASDCAVTVQVFIPGYQQKLRSGAKCSDSLQSDEPFALVLPQEMCGKTLEPGQETGVTMNVTANDDLRYESTKFESTRTTLIQFLVMRGNLQAQASFFNLAIEPVTVFVPDRTQSIQNYVCYANCDPHMKAFGPSNSQFHWEGQQSGKYILYRNLKYFTEVHVIFEGCGPNAGVDAGLLDATCICAVAIRSYGSVYHINTCNRTEDRFEFNRLPPHMRLESCPAVEMTMTAVGNTYTFTLATKTIVTVTMNVWQTFWHNIQIKPSSSDIENSDGLCGTINNMTKTNPQFKLRDGNMFTPMDDKYSPFMDDWELKYGEDIWGGLDANTEGEIFHYCGCKENVTDTIDCKLEGAWDECMNEHTINIWGKCQLKEKRRRRRQAGDTTPFDDPVEEDNYRPFTDVPNVKASKPSFHNGWTEESARNYCERTILNTSSIVACGEVPGLGTEGDIGNCIEDIKISGSTDATGIHIESIKQQCTNEITRNPDLWEESDDGGFILPTTITEVTCLNECSFRGQCVKGECVCDEGFSNIDCSKNNSAVPDLYRLPKAGLCDLRDWTCRATQVYADNLFNDDSTYCKLTHYQITKNGEEAARALGVFSGEWIQPETAVCPLPNSKDDAMSFGTERVLADVYGISISNDGDHFGNELLFVAYDSKCGNCTNREYADVSCAEKENICHIDGECYNDGEGGSHYCFTCDVSANPNAWTQTENTCFISGLCRQPLEKDPSASCQYCDPAVSTSSFQLETGTCYIDGQCHTAGVKRPDNGCFQCSPHVSQTSWSQVGDKCLIGDSCVSAGATSPTNLCMTCQPATTTSQWTWKTGTCYIDGQCYTSGTRNPNNACFQCNPETSKTGWSPVGACGQDDRQKNGAERQHNVTSVLSLIVNLLLLLLHVV